MMPSINSFQLSLFTVLMLSPISLAFVQKSVLSCLPTPTPITKSSTTSTEEQRSLLSISLDKPLGMILEEIEEGQPSGVFISELADDGSAAVSQWKDQVVGLKLATVMGNDVTNLDFDSIMDQLIAAPSPISIEFIVKAPADEEQFPVGTVVLIKVLGDKDSDETVIEAKVGDNLRQALLENNVEVYKGLKQKLGNCGGGGQCTFCAADFVDSEGWSPRSDYEDQRLAKTPNARLTCLNNIQGPCTVSL